MPVVLVAKDDVPLDEIRNRLTQEGVEAVSCVQVDALLAGKCAIDNADLVVLVSASQHFVETGDVISQIRGRLADAQGLVLCMPSPENRKRLLEQGVNEIIGTAGITAERVAERILAHLILAERIRPFNYCDGLLWGATKQMRELYRQIERCAPSDKSVLILGETGTGKGIVAKALHDLSGRTGQYVEVTCPALSGSLIENHLFGHMKGAYTDAKSDHMGLIEAARGGSIFMDEIGDLNLDFQVKLLDVVEKKRVMRVGSNNYRHVETRLIFATNQNLQELIKAKQFRLDLFQRINVFSLKLQPLCERMADIPLLVKHFLQKHVPHGKPPVQIEPDAYDVLFYHAWPGNLRELENVVERAAYMSSADEPITHNTLLGAVDGFEARKPINVNSTHSLDALEVDPMAETWDAFKDKFQAAYFISLLRKTGSNRKLAIKLSGMSKEGFYAVLRRMRQGGQLPPDIEFHDD